MTPKRKRVLIAAVVVVPSLLLIGARQVGPAKDIPAGTGYSALELCTRTMQSGEDFDHVRSAYVEPKVRPLPDLWQVEHQAGQGVTVSTWLPTLQHARTAVFRQGLGCTVVPPSSNEAKVRAQPFRAVPDAPASAAIWPLGEGAAENARLSAEEAQVIAKHAKLILGEPSQDPKDTQNATALLVAQDGALVYEQYGQGYSRDQPQLGWSMTKTMTSMIAGAMATDGKLEMDAPVGLPQWNGSEKASITWRQLLNMAPGLQWDEGYGGSSDATEMLFSQADEGAWAADRPLTSKPGTVFTYSTGFANIAMLRMRQMMGSHQGIYDYYQSRLFAPLGIRHGVIEPDASGTPVGGARGILRPVDWLRLGQLVANGGTWNGTRMLSEDYVKLLVAPSPATAEYGASIWRQPSNKIAAEIRARLPKDSVWFAGHMEQLMIVVPSRNFVMLRMGVAFGYEAVRNRVFALAANLLEAHAAAAPVH